VKHARVLYEGRPVGGIVEGDTIALENGIRIRIDEASFLAPVTPRQIFATHLSYRSRCEEYKMKAAPKYPSYFVKAIGAVSHHKATVARPRGCRFLNYEGEFAVVIGGACSNVSVERALEFVKGYTVANDWGVHDFRHADRGSMLRVKGQDGFCPLGPFLVDAADMDPDDLWLRTYVNGRLAQEAHTGSDMIFSAAYQIADISRLITLEENDVVLTGTPAHSRPVEPGDFVAVEVTGMGRLENTVVELDRELEPVGEQPAITEQTLHVALAMPEDEAKKRVLDYQTDRAGQAK
jgi:5-oxopent-3-ene-1,2,5-tricarboxylate decarboxylase/2-hydroxyhepta-2,4-diene-1,7-dioate isomerase